MTDEQAKDMILRAIQNAGVEVVTDKQVMESVLGESLWNKTVAACIEKQVITYAEGERKPDLHMVPLSVKNARGKNQLMYGVAFYGDRPKDYVPKQIGKAYKLMNSGRTARSTRSLPPQTKGSTNWASGTGRKASAVTNRRAGSRRTLPRATAGTWAPACRPRHTSWVLARQKILCLATTQKPIQATRKAASASG